MSSQNVLKFPERPEPQLKVVPNHTEQVAGQINGSREAIKVIPLDWTEDDPNFTAEELWAEQTVRTPAKKGKADPYDIDELSKVCNGFDSITAD